MALSSPGLLAVTDQKSSPAYECDRSRNGSVHGSNVSPDLPVQGQVIQQILAAAPPRDHSVRVFPPLLSFIATLAFTTSHPRTLPSISLGEHGSETLTSLSFSLHFQPDCYQLPPRCHHLRILSPHLGRARCLAIQDGLYLNPGCRTTREAYANMSALVRRSYVLHLSRAPPLPFLWAIVVPVWVARRVDNLCSDSSRSITNSQSKSTRVGNKPA